jgi:hypothetical protein
MVQAGGCQGSALVVPAKNYFSFALKKSSVELLSF